MYHFTVWIKPQAGESKTLPQRRDLRIYVNGHTIDSVRIFMIRAFYPPGTLRIEVDCSPPGALPMPALRKIVDEAMRQHRLSLTKPHWWLLLQRADWPAKYDRKGILQQFRSRLRLKPQTEPLSEERRRRNVVRD
jgi:hypothetical protein